MESSEVGIELWKIIQDLAVFNPLCDGKTGKSVTSQGLPSDTLDNLAINSIPPRVIWK